MELDSVEPMVAAPTTIFITFHELCQGGGQRQRELVLIPAQEFDFFIFHFNSSPSHAPRRWRCHLQPLLKSYFTAYFIKSPNLLQISRIAVLLPPPSTLHPLLG